MSDTEKTDDVPQEEEEEVESDSDMEEKKEEMEEEEDRKEDEEEEEESKEPEKMEEDEPESKPEPAEASPKKSPKKRKKVEKKEEEEEELPLGLLERPVVIESGKREKRKVERLAMTMTFTPQQKKKVDVPEGKGSKLGECPRIEYKISHMKSDDLKALHRILYGKKGSTIEVKRNLRQFCGFSFSKEDKEYDRRLAIISKLTLPVLKTICDVLDLEKTGLKDALCRKVMDFLMHPVDSGKKVPEPKKRGRAKGDKKEKGTKRRSEKKEGKKKKKKTSKEDVESEEDDNDEEEEDEPEENDKEDDDADEDGDVEEEEESEEEAPKKKKPKIETPKKVKKDTEEKKEKKENDKKAEKKEKTAKKPEKKEPKKKKVEVSSDDDDDSDDDSENETSAAKKSGPPNNDELRDVVKKILDGANLEEVTMKTVVKQVYAKYPEYDLSDKKDFIKNTVKQLIS